MNASVTARAAGENRFEHDRKTDHDANAKPIESKDSERRSERSHARIAAMPACDEVMHRDGAIVNERVVEKLQDRPPQRVEKKKP